MGENDFFSVGFRTTPMDNTGVSHILEHTTLCGSEKFPCRDPFFSMLTRSLSTYMNAWTGWCNSDYFCLMVGCTNTAEAGNDLLGCVSRGRAPNLSRWMSIFVKAVIQLSSTPSEFAKNITRAEMLNYMTLP